MCSSKEKKQEDYQNKDGFFQRHENLFFFFVLVGICMYANYHFYNNSLASFEEKQKAIVTRVDSCISKTDNAIANMVKYVPVKPNKKDSLYADLQTKYQKTLDDQKLHQESIKALLDLEFSKIQSEYESQEIWIGLITIVFLIFSFYSMMKTDQLEKQCRDDAQRIRSLTDENQTKFDEIKKKILTIDTEKKQKLDAIGTDFQTWKNSEIPKVKDEYRDIVDEEVKTFNETKENKLKELSDEWEKKAERTVETIKTDSRKKLEEVERQSSKEIKEAVEKAKKQAGNEIVSLIEGKEVELNRLIEEFQRKIDALPDATDLQQDFADEEVIDEHETSLVVPRDDIYDVTSDGDESGNPTTNA